MTTYSSGYCSGFAPDSLAGRIALTTRRGKGRYISLILLCEAQEFVSIRLVLGILGSVLGV